MHAALIVTELLRPRLREGAKISMNDYMLMPQEDIDAERRAAAAARLEFGEYQAQRLARRAARKAKKQ